MLLYIGNSSMYHKIIFFFFFHTGRFPGVKSTIEACVLGGRAVYALINKILDKLNNFAQA